MGCWFSINGCRISAYQPHIYRDFPARFGFSNTSQVCFYMSLSPHILQQSLSPTRLLRAPLVTQCHSWCYNGEIFQPPGVCIPACSMNAKTFLKTPAQRSQTKTTNTQKTINNNNNNNNKEVQTKTGTPYPYNTFFCLYNSLRLKLGPRLLFWDPSPPNNNRPTQQHRRICAYMRVYLRICVSICA